ncbi:MAG TPA: glycosyltransferase, partial [Candidatus Omnitrophota bacterium]|nr:glycosyltransferase [Candidatus Omnitrophota bacterium]
GGVSDALKEKYKVKEVRRVNFDEEMARVYSSADILVMPSLQDNLPNVMLESLACGTPVVAFNNSGVPDVVKHMVNGYLANNKDYKDLSNGIKLLLNNVELLKQMGASAVRFMLDEYCDKTMAEKHLELYREAIAQFQYKNGEKGHRQYDINEKI